MLKSRKWNDFLHLSWLQSLSLLPGVYLFTVAKNTSLGVEPGTSAILPLCCLCFSKNESSFLLCLILPPGALIKILFLKTRALHSSSELPVLFGFFLSIPGLLCASFPWTPFSLQGQAPFYFSFTEEEEAHTDHQKKRIVILGAPYTCKLHHLL